MHELEKKLERKFFNLLDKHGNPKWAREELDWIVFVEQADQFEQLSQEDQWVVRSYMESLKKIHGGK